MKSFDAVEMKREIQERLEKEFRGLSEEEIRKVAGERIEKNPILGPFLERLKARAGTGRGERG